MSTGVFRTAAFLALMTLAAVVYAQEAVMASSKHDLRVNNTYQLCIFCHIPHRANQQPEANLTPLWNREISDFTAFKPYCFNYTDSGSDCLGAPSGVSLVCLSCHDGTTGSGSSAVNPTNQHFLLNKTTIPVDGTEVGPTGDPDCMKCHTGTYNGIFSKALSVMGGPDLRNDHPISMAYPPTGKKKYNTPDNATTGWDDVKLFDGRVECPSCHNPHGPANGNAPFLRMDNSKSELCYRCHNLK